MLLPHKLKTKNSNKLIVIFQSFNKKLYELENIDHFELENTFQKYDIDCDLLFLKDIQRGYWYLYDLDKTKKDLYDIIKEYNKVTFTGISCGGFASILYGSLLGIDLVISVNPQTTLLDIENNEILSRNENFQKMLNTRTIDINYLDTKNHINNHTHYYLNGWSHDQNDNNTFNFMDNKQYKDMSLAEKLHDINNYDRLKHLPNVFWLNFMQYDKNFLNLIETYGY
jgi:hypothetical protein